MATVIDFAKKPNLNFFKSFVFQGEKTSFYEGKQDPVLSKDGWGSVLMDCSRKNFHKHRQFFCMPPRDPHLQVISDFRLIYLILRHYMSVRSCVSRPLSTARCLSSTNSFTQAFQGLHNELLSRVYSLSDVEFLAAPKYHTTGAWMHNAD